MPAKGKTKLPARKKVEIVIAKELRESGTTTNAALAEEFGLAETTVRGYKYDKLTDAQKALYSQIVEDLKHDAAGLTSAALRKSHELVDMADKPSHLPGVVAAGKFAHDVHRLESGQPTQITQEVLTPEQQILGFARYMAEVRGLKDLSEIADIVRRMPDAGVEKMAVAERIERGEIKLLNENN